MAITINDNFQNNSPKSLDAKYTKFVSGAATPYVSVAEVNSLIPNEYRSVGLTVLIDIGGVNVEYWYKEGILDGDLVVKLPQLSGTANYLTKWISNSVIGKSLVSEGPTGSVPADSLLHFNFETMYVPGRMKIVPKISGDANLAMSSNRHVFIQLSEISANRILALPTGADAALDGYIYIIHNMNTSVNVWQVSPVLYDQSGTLVSSLQNNKIYFVVRSNIQWRILNF